MLKTRPPVSVAGGVGVVKPEWGLKRICPNCGTRYYDFRKSPPICPACGTQYDPEALLKSRRARSGIPDEPRKLAAKAASRVEGFDEIVPVDPEEADLVPDAVDDDDGSALIEDAAELGEDSIGEVEVEPGDEEE